MIPNFKIYVTTLDEERLIGHTIGALLKEFVKEQIEVLDLGSRDATLQNIPAEVKVTNIEMPPLICGGKVRGCFFTELKNMYSKKQEWV